MRDLLKFPLLWFALLVASLPACSQQEEAPVAEAKTSPRREARIVIPEEVQGKWKAVRIAVVDKSSNREEIYTVDIGGEFRVGDSGLTLKVKNFLPAFVMDGTTITSASNKTSNPAVQLEIRNPEDENRSVWIFSLYPGAHTYQHMRYNFSLVDFIPFPPAKKG